MRPQRRRRMCGNTASCMKSAPKMDIHGVLEVAICMCSSGPTWMIPALLMTRRSVEVLKHPFDGILNMVAF